MITLRRVSKVVRQFLNNQRGNVAIIVALALPVVIAVGGGAVDFHRASLARAQAQDALDLAALSAASSKTVAPKELERMALDYLDGNIAGQLMNPDPKVDVIDPEVSGFRMTLTGSVNSLFLGLVGIPTLPINVETVVERGTEDTIEVVLVLDNTWSMSDPAGGGVAKIDALRSASNVLVNALLAKPDSQVKIGVVPYADYVNVGMSNRNAPWIDVPPDVTTTKARECKMIREENRCVRGERKTCTRERDGVSETYDCTPQTCTRVPVAEYEQCTGPTTRTDRWWGCVASRKQGSFRLNDRQGHTYPGLLSTNQNCLTPITPLTDQKTTITSAINAMVVRVGSYQPLTYIPAGMVWGINVLSSTEPMAQGAPYGVDNVRPRKIIVLMTDGQNTLSFNSSNGRHDKPTGNGAAAKLRATNNDTTALCDYAKSNKIEIFTVALAVSSDTARDLLKGCATDDEHYFDARDTSALEGAFAGIAASIYKVRIVS